MSHRFTRGLLAIALGLVLLSCRSPEPQETATPLPTEPVPPTESPTEVAISPTSTALPEPQLVANLDDATGFHPYLVGSNPPLGQEWDVNAPLELYFDQPMDPDSTAEALRISTAAGEPVDGSIEWVQPRILQFKPAEALDLGQTYQVQLAATASSAEGISLNEGISLDIPSTGPLEITQVTPLPGAFDVDTNNAVTIIFNRPIVPLTVSTEKDDFPDPLLFSPPIEGVGEWVNTSVYVFRPTEPMLSSQSYQATVSAEILNAFELNNYVLPQSFNWSFSTVPATINSFGLPGFDEYASYEAYINVPRDQSFRVRFNQSMNTEATEGAITITVDETGEQLPLETAWNDLNTTITVTPTTLLDYSRDYTFNLTRDATSFNGGQIDSTRTLPFAPVGLPAVDSIWPNTEADASTYFNNVTIRFETPMNPETLIEHLVIEPEIDLSNFYYDQWGKALTIYGLQPSTDYIVQTRPGMEDIYGTEISDSTVTAFSNGPYRPFSVLRIPGSFALYRDGGSTDIWVQYQNTSQLDMRLTPLSPNEFFNLTSFRGRPLDFNDRERADIWSFSVPIEYTENTRDLIRFDLNGPSGTPIQPGLYFVTMNSPDLEKYGDQRHNDARPILLANANITMKLSDSEAFFWVTSLETGEPIPNTEVTLFSSSGRDLLTGITDSNGIFHNTEVTLNLRDDYYAQAVGNNVFGFAMSTETEGVRSRDFDIYTDRYSDDQPFFSYVYTDRPLYRAGDTVYFKGVLRTEDDLNYELPNFPIDARVRVRNYEGEIFNEVVEINEYGTFEGSVQLDPEATLGYYDIILDLAENGGSYYSRFDVAEYRKPTFEVNIFPERRDFLGSEPIRASIEGDFFSGGAVANSDVEWYLSVSDTSFRPDNEALEGYSFVDTSDQTYFWDWYGAGYQSPYGETFASGSGKTDAQGRYLFEENGPTLAEDERPSTRRVTLESTVVDLAGNGVTGRQLFTIHPAEVYGGIKSGSRINQVGNPVRVDGVVVDWDGSLQPGQSASIEILRREWSSFQELDEETGRTVWRSTVENIPVAIFDDLVTDADGQLSAEFTPSEGGTYIAIIRVSDRSGNQTSSSTRFWVSSSSYVNWGRSSDHAFELILNQSDFEPGETAEVLIASPFQGEATALVTIERGSIYQSEVIRLDSNSAIFNLPIEGWMAPNAYISVLIVKGIDETNAAPDFKYSLAEFTVARTEQALNIEIVADDSQLGPQETVTFDLRVTDHTGAPVEAELSLSLVDKALLSLRSDLTANIVERFYGTQSLGVMTYLLLAREIDTVNEELREVAKGGAAVEAGLPTAFLSTLAKISKIPPTGKRKFKPIVTAVRKSRFNSRTISRRGSSTHGRLPNRPWWGATRPRFKRPYRS